MGTLTVDGIDEMIKQLETLEQGDSISQEMLDNATPVLEKAVESNLKNVIGKGKQDYSTGKLVSSVSMQIEKNRSGKWVGSVYFKGSVTNGKEKVRNGLKAAIMEYGKKGQIPQPFIRTAVKDNESRILQIMKATFEKRMEEIK